MAWELFQFVFLLAVVMALAVVTTRLMARRYGAAQSGRFIRVVESVGLGPKGSLCLARTGARLLLLGVTEHAVNLIAELDGATAVDAPPERRGAGEGFLLKLRSVLEGALERKDAQ